MSIVSQRRKGPTTVSFGPSPGRRRRLRPLWVILGLLLTLLAAAVAFFAVFGISRPSLVPDSSALAKLSLPLGGATVRSVSAVTGPHSRRVPVHLQGGRIWPNTRIPAGESITLDVVIQRPGWIAWLSGKRQHLTLIVTTPTAKLAQSYVTLRRGAPLRLHYSRTVTAIAYGSSASHLVRHILPTPSREVTLERTAAAGSIWISAVVLGWEETNPQAVSWFPAGNATAAVANPAPGSTIRASTPIELTFSKPVAKALGRSRPPVSPATAGTWHNLNSHTIVFRPTGYGYGLGASVRVALPAGVRLVGGRPGSSAEVGTWTVPPGSTLRLQQLLAKLGYLPLVFRGPTVPSTPGAQEAAAVKPPHGTFAWRYGNVPGALRSMWQPGAFGVMTRGAVMRFENDHGLTTDGQAGPAVWKSLIGAAVAGRVSSFGYNFVMVSEGSPESLTMWHNGKDMFSVPVNTGIASRPTAQGTYPVFEHVSSTTMSGTNPDGSHYSDPGIPWVSYFNGGDALHGFYRAQYGFPQSLGCVEMTVGDAGRVYPYTPIGTLVNVS